jgi:hypothetical protein
MGINEREIAATYLEMYSEVMEGVVGTRASYTDEVVAILTAARILKRVMEKCAIEISGSIDQLRQPSKYAMTHPQAMAIIDMDNRGYSEGLGPKTEEGSQGWGQLLELAEVITDRKADGSQ